MYLFKGILMNTSVLHIFSIILEIICTFRKTRMTASKKMEDDQKKNFKKMEDDLKKRKEKKTT